MLPLLVASKLDPAGHNMAHYMIDKHGFKAQTNNVYTNRVATLLVAEEELLTMEWLDKEFLPSYYVFLSRHRSESGIPTLTCHTTGNFSDSNAMGGRPRELAYTYPSLQKHYMKTVHKEMFRIHDYHLVIEATHHGPTSLAKPVLFIEIGSTENQWNDHNAISVVCDAVIDAMKTVKSYGSVGIGLGGTHYPSKFTKILISSDYALASIASKHSLSSLDKTMLEQMISKSIEEVKYIFMDLKGLGREKDRLNNIINEIDLEVVRL
ncbi:MAG: D-aminoacyl-tRNA deacylase [Nitrososphaerales archaeon]